jgi:hypothetical protein
LLRKTLVLFVGILGCTQMLHAQAAPAASRAADLQVGGGYSNGSPDYGPNRVNGGTAYVDFDFYRHIGIEGEFRFVKDGETNIYEKTYEIGGRYSRPLPFAPKLVPYGKFLYGRGVFNFTSAGQAYANLAYNMIAIGGGVDYRLLRHVNLRGDFEYQNWFGFPGPEIPPSPGHGNNGLTPSVFTIGGAYHF